MSIYKSIVACFVLMSFAATAFAQETEVVAPEPEPTIPLTAVIKSQNNVQVDRNIIFDGTDSLNPSPERELTFQWDFGDTTQEIGPEVVHSYATPDLYTVTLTVSNGLETASAEQQIFVYQDFLLMYTSGTEMAERVTSLQDYTSEQHALLTVFEDEESQTDIEATSTLTKNLAISTDELSKSTLVLFWARGTTILGALSDFAKQKDPSLDFSNKTLVFVSEENLRPLSRLAQNTFDLLKPKQIVLTRPEALFTVVDTKNGDLLIEGLKTRGYEYAVVNVESGRISPFNFMSHLVNYMRNQGVSSETILLILMLPVIATIVAFFRQVVGLTTVGIYTPTIITVSFVTLGLTYGLLTLAFVLLIGTLSRYLFKQSRYRLLYVPRMAIIITLTSLSFLFLLALSSYAHLTPLTETSILPILILITLIEVFLTVQVERGVKAALLLMIETTVVAVVCYLIVAQWQAFQILILGYPELLFAAIVVNILLGKWTGLRLNEFFRFRAILDHVEHAEEE